MSSTQTSTQSTSSDPLIVCRACGLERRLSDYRIFSTHGGRVTRFDFCTPCEHLNSTIVLYRRYTAYATPEIVEAVFKADRTPEAKRSADQQRFLIQKKEVQRTPQALIEDELQRRELSRRRLIFYIKRFMPEYKVGWVHHDVARRIEKFMRDVEQGLSPRLMVFMPPRTGKSKEVSDFAVSWMMGHHPEWEFINASYAQALPIEFSRGIRDRLGDVEHQRIFPKCLLRRDSQAIDRWTTTAGGGYMAAGIGVGITGRGFNVGIVDDPVKDQEAAQSETIRAATLAWYQSVFRTRAAPGAGILIVQCMVGGTRVLMADGSEKALRDVRVGDRVATYTNGCVGASTVLNWANNGPDYTFAISTISGKIIRANERHPFLVQRGGSCEWVRLRDLKPGDLLLQASRISACANGAESRVEPTGVALSHGVMGFARTTTTNTDGLVERGHRPSIRDHAVQRISSIVTVLRSQSTTRLSWLKKTVARFAAACQEKAFGRIGAASSVSTISPGQKEFVGCCATTATCVSGTAEQSQFCSPQQNMYAVTPDEIVSVAAASYEDVFDIQVEGTENFIADGVVSHNTRWHDADLAGALLEAENELRQKGVPEEELDGWQVVSYPALAEEDEYLLEDGSIYQGKPGSDLRVKRLLRRKDEAIHPERYSASDFKKLRNTIAPSIWSALYQQNPAPDDGDYFKRSDFRYLILDKRVWVNGIIITTADYAFKEKSRNDWTVIATGVLMPDGKLYVVDIKRGRWRSNDVAKQLLQTFKELLPTIFGGEQGATHSAIWPFVQEELDKPINKHIAVVVDESLQPIQDKMLRARPLQAMFQQHQIVFSMDMTQKTTIWDVTERELLRFPTGAHDDIVDALAWMARIAKNTPLPVPQTPEPPKSFRDELSQYVTDHSAANSFMAG